jgi:hypothetical protein
MRYSQNENVVGMDLERQDVRKSPHDSPPNRFMARGQGLGPGRKRPRSLADAIQDRRHRPDEIVAKSWRALFVPERRASKLTSRLRMENDAHAVALAHP